MFRLKRNKGIFLIINKVMDKIKFIMTRHKPLTSDHRFAIFSWLLFGTSTLIVLGTTTLVSLILWFVNTFEFSEWTAKKIGKYLTNNTGINISFEHARGEWKTGYIRLENVTVSRRPRRDEHLSSIQLSIRQVDIKLSILWLLEGRGIIKECLASGVRGIIDRRSEGLKIDGVNIEMLSRNATGPLGWMKEGTFDIQLNLLLPVVSDAEILESEHNTVEYGTIPSDRDQLKNVHLQFKVQLNHLYSVAPLYTPEISYLSNALAHPIVAYINSHSKHIPLEFNFSMNVRNYNGAWTLSQASFWDMLSAAVGSELVAKVQATKSVTTIKQVASELISDFIGWIGPLIQKNREAYEQIMLEHEREMELQQQKYLLAQ
eukprot:gene3798-4379_t